MSFVTESVKSESSAAIIASPVSAVVTPSFPLDQRPIQPHRSGDYSFERSIRPKGSYAMVKPLSEQLADMSASAKKAEDAITAARKETHDKIELRREQARAAASAAAAKVDANIKSVGAVATGQWTALQTKVAADLDRLKAKRAQHQHERDVKRAKDRADRMEWEAGIAIEYAIASIEDAKLAVLDAVIANVDAQEAQSA
jgi:hypothetical protein